MPMNYAVIESGGKQYITEVGKKLTLDKIESAEGEKFFFDKVLLLRAEDSVTVGAPYIPNAKVIGKVIRQFKGEKIDVLHVKNYAWRGVNTVKELEEAEQLVDN